MFLALGGFALIHCVIRGFEVFGKGFVFLAAAKFGGQLALAELPLDGGEDPRDFRIEQDRGADRDELIAADAVVFAREAIKGGSDSLGSFLDQGIPGLVALGVVDEFQFVDIEDEDGLFVMGALEVLLEEETVMEGR